MKKLLSLFLFLFPLLAMAQPQLLPSTLYTRGLLRATDAAGARTLLELAATNVSVLAATNVNTDQLAITDQLLSLKTGGTLPAMNAAALTGIPIGFPTNAINTGVIPVGNATYTNIAGNITLAGFSGVDTARYQTAVLVITNATAANNYSVTLPANIVTETNLWVLGNVVWVTNKTKAILEFTLGLGATNCRATRMTGTTYVPNAPWPEQ